jgi:hypothetical protein
MLRDAFLFRWQEKLWEPPNLSKFLIVKDLLHYDVQEVKNEQVFLFSFTNFIKVEGPHIFQN